MAPMGQQDQQGQPEGQAPQALQDQQGHLEVLVERDQQVLQVLPALTAHLAVRPSSMIPQVTPPTQTQEAGFTDSITSPPKPPQLRSILTTKTRTERTFNPTFAR